MKPFVAYMIEQGLNLKSAKAASARVDSYVHWCEVLEYTPQNASQEVVMQFLADCKDQGNKPLTIRQKLYYISCWYRCIGRGHDNPCEDLKIRGIKRPLPPKALPQSLLNSYFENYQARSLTDRRNRMILGCLVLYGVELGSLERMEVQDVLLREGKIRFPATNRTNERLLAIEHAGFLLAMQDYLLRDRPMLHQLLGAETDQLFFTLGGSPSLRSVLPKLFYKVKVRFPSFPADCSLIRSMVISNLVETHSLLEAQYRAGHRYVSSTERYRVADVVEMQKKLEGWHPLE